MSADTWRAVRPGPCAEGLPEQAQGRPRLEILASRAEYVGSFGHEIYRHTGDYFHHPGVITGNQISTAAFCKALPFYKSGWKSPGMVAFFPPSDSGREFPYVFLKIRRPDPLTDSLIRPTSEALPKKTTRNRGGLCHFFSVAASLGPFRKGSGDFKGEPGGAPRVSGPIGV